jgi:hypothetical protein
MNNRIIALDKRKAPEFRSPGDHKLIRKLTSHVERNIGRVERVFHDLESDVVHIDILWIEPGPGRDFHTFVTCGMSEQPMQPCTRRCRCRYAELLLRLPRSWPLRPEELQLPRNLWPIRELEFLARAPHLHRIHLWGGDTVANGDPDRRLRPLNPATRFSATVLAEPDWTPSAFRRLRVGRDRRIRFFSVIPLYAEEFLLDREQGAEALLAHLEQAGVDDLLDVDRPNLLAAADPRDREALSHEGQDPG